MPSRRCSQTTLMSGDPTYPVFGRRFSFIDMSSAFRVTSFPSNSLINPACKLISASAQRHTVHDITHLSPTEAAVASEMPRSRQ
eukprot:3557843-Rhodomonas_salina.3